MHFSVEHRFDSDPDTVQRAMVDPGFYAALSDLPDVEAPVVLDRRDGDGFVRLRVRYVFSGDLPSVARKVVGGDELAWVQASTVDLARRHTDFRVLPETHADRLVCSGTYQLHADGQATRREIAGDLSVRVPLLAGRAERAIVSGLLERIEAEARALARWLDR